MFIQCTQCNVPAFIVQLSQKILCSLTRTWKNSCTIVNKLGNNMKKHCKGIRISAVKHLMLDATKVTFHWTGLWGAFSFSPGASLTVWYSGCIWTEFDNERRTGSTEHLQAVRLKKRGQENCWRLFPWQDKKQIFFYANCSKTCAIKNK